MLSTSRQRRDHSTKQQVISITSNWVIIIIVISIVVILVITIMVTVVVNVITITAEDKSFLQAAGQHH